MCCVLSVYSCLKTPEAIILVCTSLDESWKIKEMINIAGDFCRMGDCQSDKSAGQSAWLPDDSLGVWGL